MNEAVKSAGQKPQKKKEKKHSKIIKILHITGNVVIFNTIEYLPKPSLADVAMRLIC